MSRRKIKNKTGLVGTGAVDYQKLYVVFQCLNPECKNFFEVPESGVDYFDMDNNIFVCSACGFKHDTTLDDVYISGYFEKFLEKAPAWKYCRICENLKPIDVFDKHARMPSGHQMECKVCKWVINAKLNPLRTRDQLREGSEGRRLLEVFRNEEKVKIDESEIREKFKNECFKCKRDLSKAKRSDFHIDHVLPAKYLWRLEDATALLCGRCNLEKRDKWPSHFYSVDQLKELSLYTGMSFELLSSKEPKINPDALEKAKQNADEIYRELADRPREMKKLRNIILKVEGIDIIDYIKSYNKEDILKLLSVY